MVRPRISPLTQQAAKPDLLLIFALVPGHLSAVATVILLTAYFLR
jgi:hypothetical protein